MAPAFITKIRDTRVSRGHQAVFECIVPDTKGVCCKWLHDGREIEIIARIRVQTRTIEGFTTSELIIDEVEPEDAGKYTVIVENSAGQDRCEANLTVIEDIDKPYEMPPDFVIKLRDKSVKPNERVTFECKAVGEPKPEITWRRGNELLVDEPAKHFTIERDHDGTQRLTLDNVQPDEPVLIAAVAENKLGKAQTEGTLTVETSPPTFTRPLQDQRVALGESFVLECSVVGVPQPLVEYFTTHDDFRIQTGTRVSIQHDTTNTHWRLVVKNATEQDLREYRAVATSSSGTASCTAKVEKRVAEEEKPRILEGLKKVKVFEHDTAEMSVKIAGLPLPSVEWFKGKEPIRQGPDKRFQFVEFRESGQYKLIIKDAQLGDDSSYQVVVSNSRGSETSKGHLTVEERLSPPQFIEHLKEASVKESESHTFTATVKGEPKPKCIWIKDQRPLVCDGEHVVVKEEAEGRHSLTITNARQEDAAKYSITAVNSVGQAESSAAFAVLEDVQSPEFIENLKPLEVKEGEDAQLKCTVTGKPTPTVSFFKDGRPIEIDNTHLIVNHEGEGRHSLTIKQATPTDSAIFSAKAVNKAGRDETIARFGVLEDLEAPHFTQELDDELSVKEGAVAVLECIVKGRPMPKIEWLRDGRPINIDTSGHLIAKEGEGGKHTLTINNARVSDAGTFTAKAINKAGTAQTQLELYFPKRKEAESAPREEAKPLFIRELQAATIKEGEQVELVCQVNKQQSHPTIKWMRKDQPIDVEKEPNLVMEEFEDGTLKLRILRASKAEVGVYKCEAVNKVGKAQTSAALKYAEERDIDQAKMERPLLEFIRHLKNQQAVEGHSVIFECQLSSASAQMMESVSIEWSKDGVQLTQQSQLDRIGAKVEREMDTGIQRLIIDRLKFEHLGVFRCKASEREGGGSSVWTEGRLIVTGAGNGVVESGSGCAWRVDLTISAA